MRLAVSVILFMSFTVYTAVVVVDKGFGPLLQLHTAGAWSVQILVDLVFALSGFMTLAVPDARRRGIAIWPYIAMILALGSIGMLAYFVHRELRAIRAPALAS